MVAYSNPKGSRSPPARVLPPSSRGTRCSANATGQSSRSADRPARLGCSAKRSKSHLRRGWPAVNQASRAALRQGARSEEHTSELQSQFHLVCRLLLEKKKISH